MKLSAADEGEARDYLDGVCDTLLPQVSSWLYTSSRLIVVSMLVRSSVFLYSMQYHEQMPHCLLYWWQQGRDIETEVREFVESDEKNLTCDSCYIEYVTQVAYLPHFLFEGCLFISVSPPQPLCANAAQHPEVVIRGPWWSAYLKMRVHLRRLLLNCLFSLSRKPTH